MIILCLIGKSASGKTFVRDKLVKEHGYKSLVTFTSRPPRKGEKQDITYHLFPKKILNRKLKKDFLQNGRNMILSKVFGIMVLH